jgi:hypothetical protein
LHLRIDEHLGWTGTAESVSDPPASGALDNQVRSSGQPKTADSFFSKNEFWREDHDGCSDISCRSARSECPGACRHVSLPDWESWPPEVRNCLAIFTKNWQSTRINFAYQKKEKGRNQKFLYKN